MKTSESAAATAWEHLTWGVLPSASSSCQLALPAWSAQRSPSMGPSLGAPAKSMRSSPTAVSECSPLHMYATSRCSRLRFRQLVLQALHIPWPADNRQPGAIVLGSSNPGLKEAPH